MEIFNKHTNTEMAKKRIAKAPPPIPAITEVARFRLPDWSFVSEIYKYI